MLPIKISHKSRLTSHFPWSNFPWSSLLNLLQLHRLLKLYLHILAVSTSLCLKLYLHILAVSTSLCSPSPAADCMVRQTDFPLMPANQTPYVDFIIVMIVAVFYLVVLQFRIWQQLGIQPNWVISHSWRSKICIISIIPCIRFILTLN